MNYLYLAYGSNLNKRQMARRCPDAVPVGSGTIDDYELVFRRGYLTIEPKKGSSVPVGVWKITEEDEKALDRYEGYPKFYRKEYFAIQATNGKTYRYMVYIMKDGHPIQAPTDEYFYTVRLGYNDFGLKDKSKLEEAYLVAKYQED